MSHTSIAIIAGASWPIVVALLCYLADAWLRRAAPLRYWETMLSLLDWLGDTVAIWYCEAHLARDKARREAGGD